jgi:hypothetical protein
MPRQTPSDQGYPEKSGWIDSHRQPPRNGSSADPDRAQPYIGQPVTAAVPLPSAPAPLPSAPAPLPSAPAPPPAAAPRSPLTRRSILRSVAGVGAVGAAAAIGAGAVIRFDKPAASLKPVGKPVAMAPMAPSAMAGPLVVYIADTTNGLLDVFGGTGATQVRNPDLVNELLANLKLA